jgi:hypothetical protein
METLPWELIGIIGGYLLPRWRCRLYLCRREWYRKYYSGLLEWRRNINGVLNEIAKIKYKYFDYYSVSNSYIQYSTRKYGDNYISYIYAYTYKSDTPTQIKLVTTINIGNNNYMYDKSGNGCTKVPAAWPVRCTHGAKKIIGYVKINKKKKAQFDSFIRLYAKNTGFVIKNI